MITKPAISVIIPVYNTEKYLIESFNSLLNQTFKDFEVICINDGSTDGSLKLLEDFAANDSRIKIFTQPKSGASAARNLGLKHALGDYIKFLDSDDIFAPNMLERLYSEITKHNADIAICMYTSFDNMTKNNICIAHIFPEFRHFDTTFSADEYAEIIFQVIGPNIWPKLYKASFIKNSDIRFPNQQSVNDFYFAYASLVSAKKIIMLDESLIKYRCNLKSSTTLSNISTNLVNSIIAGNDLYRFLLENNLFEEYKDSFMQRVAESLRYYLSFVSILKVPNLLKTIKNNKDLFDSEILFDEIYSNALKAQYKRGFKFRLALLLFNVQTAVNFLLLKQKSKNSGLY